MLLSRACEYGLRACLYLAASPTTGYVSIRGVSDTLGVPYPFLAKIVQTLTQQDILTSSRGPSGGIALARAPEQIMLREVVRALDGDAVFTECVLGLPGCGEQKPCPLHDRWAPTRTQIERMFDEVSLADMATRIRNNDFRLSLLSTQS